MYESRCERFKYNKINSSLSLGQIFRFLQIDAHNLQELNIF